MKTVLSVANGRILYVHSDAAAGVRNRLTAAGAQATTKRASHVEPTADNRWTADMGPVGGPVLGPFATHAEAIAAETEYLRRILDQINH